MTVQGRPRRAVEHVHEATGGCLVQLQSALRCGICACHRLAWVPKTFWVCMVLTAPPTVRGLEQMTFLGVLL